jgi:predicted RNA-binding protein with PUA-like domain
MKYFLLKSEPDSYSIDDFKKDKVTIWEGVRNYRARNIIRDEMAPGDLFFFYHSMDKNNGVVGIGEIVDNKIADIAALDKKNYYYDPKVTKDKNPWFSPKVKFVSKFKRAVSLDEIKKNKKLQNMVLVKIARLSVQPVTKQEFEVIKKLGEM